MLGRPRRSSTDRMNTIGRIAPDREYNARGNDGGFAPLEALLRRVAGVSRLYWCNSPPFGGGEAAVRGGEAPKVQNTSATNADNGALRARWPALWTQRCLAGRPPTRRACGGIHAPTMKQPPSMLIVTRQHTGKSLHNQHVVSILHVRSHHLKYRLSRTSTPKSLYTTNTLCPSTGKKAGGTRPTGRVPPDGADEGRPTGPSSSPTR